MKKIAALLLSLVALCLFAVLASADDSLQVYRVPYAYAAPVMDGAIDDVFYEGTPIPVQIPSSDNYSNPVSGTAYFAYDDKFLYLVVDVKDSTPCAPLGTFEKNSDYDGIFFAFNFTNEEYDITSNSYDHVGYMQVPAVSKATSSSAVTIHRDANGNQTGYTVEIRKAFPSKYSFNSVKSGSISFAIWCYDHVYNAATGQDANLGSVMTHAGQQNAYRKSVGFPTAVGIAVSGGWDGLELIPHAYQSNNLGNNTLTVDGQADFIYSGAPAIALGDKGTLRSAWDNENIYFLAEINDTSKNGADSVSFYVDFDNSAAALTSGGNNGIFTVGRDGKLTVSGGKLSSLQAEVAAVATDAGYNVEIRIPMNGFNPAYNTNRYFLASASVSDNGNVTWLTGENVSSSSETYGKFRLSSTTFIIEIYAPDGTLIEKNDGVSSVFTLPDDTEYNGKKVVGWISNAGKIYAADATVKPSADTLSFTMLASDLRVLPSVSVRLTGDETSALRFTSVIDRYTYDTLHTSAENVSFGAIVIPSEETATLEKITHRGIRARRLAFCDVIASGFSESASNGTEYGWYSAIKNIPISDLTRDFVCVPYISYKDAAGDTVYIYGSYDTDKVYSIRNTLFYAFEDRDASYANPTDAGINSPYTADQLSYIKSHLDKSIVLTPMVDGSITGLFPKAASYYTCPYAATYSDGVLTVYAASADILSGVTAVQIGLQSFPVSPAAGATEVSVNIGNSFGSIRLNQIGYRTDSIKRAVVTDGGKIFWVVDATTGTIVYAGPVEPGSYEELAGEVVNHCDFSDLTTPGIYYLMVDINAEQLSYPFAIGDDIYDEARSLVLKCYYYNRCGCAINVPEYNMKHAACHLGNAIVREFDGDSFLDKQNFVTRLTKSTGEVVQNVVGGWHDAGDYGRYATWETCSAAKLLISYLMDPAAFGDDSGIPESGNGVPDILDEVYYDLIWLMKLQRADGAVYHKLTSEQHASINTMPEYDNSQFYLYPVSREATADFAGVMALASVIYKNIAPDFANTCLTVAKSAYDWASASTMNCYPSRDGSGTGIGASANIAYDLAFAASALYQATGNATYHSAFTAYGSQNLSVGNAAFDCGIAAYVLNPANRDQSASFLDTLRGRFKTYRQDKIDKYYKTPYEFSLYTGSYANQSLAGQNATLILGDLLNGNEDTRWLIEENANYILGKNATGYCGITGMGTQQIQNPHLRFNVPGWLTGGATSYEVLKSRFASYLESENRITASTPALKCYLDEFVYFYLNEPTISSNANALIMLVYLAK